MRSHAHYNVKPSIITSSEQRQRMLRREMCFGVHLMDLYWRIGHRLAKENCSQITKISFKRLLQQLPHFKSFFIHIY